MWCTHSTVCALLFVAILGAYTQHRSLPLFLSFSLSTLACRHLGKVVGIEYVSDLAEQSVKNVRKSHADLLDDGTLTITRTCVTCVCASVTCRIHISPV